MDYEDVGSPRWGNLYYFHLHMRYIFTRRNIKPKRISKEKRRIFRIVKDQSTTEYSGQTNEFGNLFAEVQGFAYISIRFN